MVKEWPKCFTADVRDGNEALTHVTDHRVKLNYKKKINKRGPQIML